jgi:hypothetical protein
MVDRQIDIPDRHLMDINLSRVLLVITLVHETGHKTRNQSHLQAAYDAQLRSERTWMLSCHPQIQNRAWSLYVLTAPSPSQLDLHAILELVIL